MQQKNVAVITGIREELSLELLNRFRNLLPNYDWNTGSSSNIAEIAGCRVIGYPSKRTKDLRGLVDTKLVIVDEMAHFDSTDARNLLPVVEAFQAKSDAQVVLLSTPGPIYDNVFYDLFQEPEQTCRYKRLYIPIQKALGTLISEQEASMVRKSPNYLTEFELHWQSYDANSILSISDIDTAVSMGREYATKDPNYFTNALRYGQSVIGVDPSGGGTSSMHAVTMLTLYDGKVHVMYAREFSAAEHTEDDVIDLIVNKLWLNGTRKRANIFLDFAQPTFLRKVKSAIRVHDQTEIVDVTRHLEFIKKHGFLQKDYRNIGQQMIACGISMGTFGPSLLQTLVTLFQRQQFVLIELSFPELVQQLKIARTKPSATQPWQLDKSQNYLDLVDSTRLACFPFLETTTNNNNNQYQYSSNEIL